MNKFALLTALIIFTLCSSQLCYSYYDISNDYKYSTAIQFITDEEIVSGYPNGSYKPQKTIIRAELLKILINANFNNEEIDNCAETYTHPQWDYIFFPDVPKDVWYAKYVCVAKINHIIQGYRDGNFHPEKEVNFVEALKLTLLTFDYSVVEKKIWYKNYVDLASGKNFIPLDITDFNQKINRGQMADMITRVLTSQENQLENYLDTKKDYKVTYTDIQENINVEYSWEQCQNGISTFCTNEN